MRRKCFVILGPSIEIGCQVEVGVKTSTGLLALDLREPTAPLMELALVLGRELLWGDCASPVNNGGVGAADELIGKGDDGLIGIWIRGVEAL